MVIQIFVTGGTFDKEYDELAGSLVFKETHVQEVLRLGRCQAGSGHADADDDRQP